MKPIPASRMDFSISGKAASILTPSAVNTSAAPARDDSARLPCLATGMPQPATTSAAAVDMLSVPAPSPPVPTTSIASSGAPDPRCLGAHGPRRPGDLVHRLAAQPEGHQERADLRRRGVAGHDGIERALGLFFAEAMPVRDPAQHGLESVEVFTHGNDLVPKKTKIIMF